VVTSTSQGAKSSATFRQMDLHMDNNCAWIAGQVQLTNVSKVH
jgi:hypothetical protein